MTHVVIRGSSSIDGPSDLNAKLSFERSQSVLSYLSGNTTLSGVIFDVVSEGENWPFFIQLVKSDNLLPSKEEVLKIVDSDLHEDKKEEKLRILGNGRAWRYLSRSVFPVMRHVAVTLESISGRLTNDTVGDSVVVRKGILNPEVLKFRPEKKKNEVIFRQVEIRDSLFLDLFEMKSPLGEWTRRMYLKTNALGWIAAMFNVGVEVDLCQNLSFQVSGYWSGWNYFKSDIKMRVLSFSPELRFWFHPDNRKFFANVHFGTAWYNVAFGGNNRWQDHNRNTPAVGGGIGFGWKGNISRNGRWAMEVCAGAGVYRLDYDIFLNKPSGLMSGRRKKTFYGVDQAAVSFSYSFGLKKKGVAE